MKTKVLLIFADTHSIHTKRWAYAMHDRGMQVHVIGRYMADLGKGIRVYPLQNDIQGNKKTRLYLLWQVCMLPLLVRKINPDVVNPHFVSSYGLLGGFSHFRPLHLTAWGSDILQVPQKNPLIKWLLKILFWKANSYNTDSQAVMDAISDGICSTSGQIIKWGTDTGIFTPMAKSDPNKMFTIFSNRLWERVYNIDVILHAYALFRDLYQGQSRLKVAGFGRLQSKLKAQAGDGVEFMGNIASESAMATALHTSHLYVSIPATDSGAVSVIEALATDTPTIVSDIAGNSPFPVTKTQINAQQLAEKMLHIAQNYDNYVKMHTKIGADIRKNNNRRACMDKAFSILNAL